MTPPKGGDQWEGGTLLAEPNPPSQTRPPSVPLQERPCGRSQHFGVQRKALEAPSGGGGPRGHGDNSVGGHRYETTPWQSRKREGDASRDARSLAVSSSSVVREKLQCAGARAAGVAGSVVLQLQALVQAAREDHAEHLGRGEGTSGHHRQAPGVPCARHGPPRPTARTCTQAMPMPTAPMTLRCSWMKVSSLVMQPPW